MIAVNGYFDGVSIQPLEQVLAKPNQRVIITFTNEFVNPAETGRKKGIRGILAQYANPVLAEKEKGAWERAVAEKYGNI